MNLPLNNKFQAKWLQRVNEEFLSIVEAEYESHSDKPFWEFRPTRLFAIKPSPETLDIYQKEYERLEKVFNSNYYKKECLENLFSDDEIILELIKKPRKLLPEIVFPAVIENEEEANKNYPLVSFSPYYIRSLFDDIEKKYIDICEHIFESIFYLTPNEYKSRYLYCFPQLANFLKAKGDSYQLSLVMQIWCELNKSILKKYNMPSICATGMVSDNGEVLAIDKAEIKLESAYNMGFDYILFPKGNEEKLFEQLKSLPNKNKVLFFSNIKDVFEWLSLLTDKNRDIRAVKIWGEEGLVKPDSEAFADYFNLYEKPIDWKRIIRGDFDEKLEKLKIFTIEYCKYQSIPPFTKVDINIADRGIFYEDNFVAVSEINIAIDFFIKNKDKFFTQNVDISKAWREYLGIAMPLSEVRHEDYQNLIDITEIVKKSTEPQINYNSNIEDWKQFLYEFIRTFCFGKDINSLFQPVVWKSKDYRNLFTTLSIQILCSNKELLKRYLVEIVSDVDNLILGFDMLK